MANLEINLPRFFGRTFGLVPRSCIRAGSRPCVRGPSLCVPHKQWRLQESTITPPGSAGTSETISNPSLTWIVAACYKQNWQQSTVHHVINQGMRGKKELVCFNDCATKQPYTWYRNLGKFFAGFQVFALPAVILTRMPKISLEPKDLFNVKRDIINHVALCYIGPV